MTKQTLGKGSLRYVACVEPVREIALMGHADAKLWSPQLLREGLEPLEQDGRVEVLICAANMRWGGVTFTEVTFSVRLATATPIGSAIYLSHGFTSSGLFAFMERLFFKTPYRSAKCRFSLEPLFVEVEARQKESFSMKSSKVDLDCVRPEHEEHNFTVFVPGGNFFVAVITGESVRFPFRSQTDLVSWSPGDGSGIWRQLDESGFQPVEWILRQSARHSKTKTFRKSALAEFAC
jgi:hypothetical protein